MSQEHMGKEFVEMLIRKDLEHAEQKRDEWKEKADRRENGAYTIYTMYDAEARAYRSALDSLQYL